MKFVDHVTIDLKAGDGGPGAISFYRAKFVPKGGPDGGNGGAGGNIIFRADARLQTLMDLKLRGIAKAGNGNPGGRKNQQGLDGEDTFVPVPCGTLVLDPSGTPIADLVSDGQEVIIAKGGKGGRGNSMFKSSTNRTPRYAQPGLPGDSMRVTLELRLIAEVGLIGLPNAGKSTLLKHLTRANPKIAPYPFTTLFPNLGVLKSWDREVVVADIPGLIEGASEGHGLGADFLRHIDRTKFLIHLVAVDPENLEQSWENYQLIRAELGKSTFHLIEKAELVVLTKIDLISEDQLHQIEHLFNKNEVAVLAISAATNVGLEPLISTILERTGNGN